MPKTYYERAKDVNVGGVILKPNSSFEPFSFPTVCDPEDDKKKPYGYEELSQLFYINQLLIKGDNNELCRPNSIYDSTGIDPVSGKEIKYCTITYNISGVKYVVTSYDTYKEEPGPTPPGPTPPEPGVFPRQIPEEYRNGSIATLNYNNYDLHVGDTLDPNDFEIIWGYWHFNPDTQSDEYSYVELPINEYFGIIGYSESGTYEFKHINEYVVNTNDLSNVYIVYNTQGGEPYQYGSRYFDLHLAYNDPYANCIIGYEILSKPDKLLYYNNDTLNFAGLEIRYYTANGNSIDKYINNNDSLDEYIGDTGYKIKPTNSNTLLNINGSDSGNFYSINEGEYNYTIDLNHISDMSGIEISDIKYINGYYDYNHGLRICELPNILSAENSIVCRNINKVIPFFIDNDNIIDPVNDNIFSKILIYVHENSIRRVFETSENINADDILSQNIINSSNNQPGTLFTLYYADGSYVQKGYDEYLNFINDITNIGRFAEISGEMTVNSSEVGSGYLIVYTSIPNYKEYNGNNIFNWYTNNSSRSFLDNSLEIYIVNKRIPESLYIYSSPYKTDYIVGESFVPNGMTVGINSFENVNDDYLYEPIPYESLSYLHDEFNPYDNLDISDDYQEPISYTENDVTLTINQQVTVSAQILTTDVNVDPDYDLFGKVIGDLQSNVSVQGNEIFGTLNYVSDYTGFSSDVSLQSGNYLVIHNTSNFSDPITVELVNGISGPVQLDSDGIIVLRITDKDTQYVRVTSGSITNEYTLTGLVLEQAQ